MEEEGEDSKWQDRISSGFERLVAFASTELDKRRRSTEGNDSCNTSPDSGIGHGDPPIPTISVAQNKQSIKLNPNSKGKFFKIPAYKKYTESPSILEQSSDELGPPRTPSPISPANATVNYSPDVQINVERTLNPALLKYQRHTEEKKPKPDQHFKKKFYYREQWRDEMWRKPEERQETVKDKFKPKGKEWNWHNNQNDYNLQNSNEEWIQNNEQYSWKN